MQGYRKPTLQFCPGQIMNITLQNHGAGIAAICAAMAFSAQALAAGVTASPARSSPTSTSAVVVDSINSQPPSTSLLVILHQPWSGAVSRLAPGVAAETPPEHAVRERHLK
jgi:hypothetical protein